MSKSASYNKLLELNGDRKNYLTSMHNYCDTKVLTKLVSSFVLDGEFEIVYKKYENGIEAKIFIFIFGDDLNKRYYKCNSFSDVVHLLRVLNFISEGDLIESEEVERVDNEFIEDLKLWRIKMKL